MPASYLDAAEVKSKPSEELAPGGSPGMVGSMAFAKRSERALLHFGHGSGTW